MNAEERFKLIKAKLAKPSHCKAKPAGLHLAEHPEKRRASRGKSKPYLFACDERKPFTIRPSYTGNAKELGNGAEWVAVPIKRPKRPLAPKRTKKVSPLTRISQLLPMKLKKVLTGEL